MQFFSSVLENMTWNKQAVDREMFDGKMLLQSMMLNAYVFPLYIGRNSKKGEKKEPNYAVLFSMRIVKE